MGSCRLARVGWLGQAQKSTMAKASRRTRRPMVKSAARQLSQRWPLEGAEAANWSGTLSCFAIASPSPRNAPHLPTSHREKGQYQEWA